MSGTIKKFTDKELTHIIRKEQILRKKIEEIKTAASGMETPLCCFIDNGIYSDTLELTTDLAAFIPNNSSTDIYDSKLYYLVYDYLYLATTVCYWFETNSEASINLSPISNMHFSSLISLLENEAYDVYLNEKYGNDADGTIEDLLWYQINWTDSVYDFKGFYGIFKILQIVVSALEQSGYRSSTQAPDYCEQKEVPQGIDINSVYFEEEFYEYDKETNPSSFHKLIERQKKESNDYLINQMLSFTPDINNPVFFLDCYYNFLELYAKTDLRKQLLPTIKKCVSDFLLCSRLTILSNEEQFEHVYYNLMLTLDCLKEFTNENMMAILSQKESDKKED